MEKRDNYKIQAAQARARFLTYDQQSLIRKFRMKADAEYLYTRMLATPYRISRTTGDLQRQEENDWQDANTYNEVMTLLDLLCDSRDERWISGRWKNMQSFGLQFHRNLLEEARDPLAELFDREPDRLLRAMERLGAERISGGDYGYAVELFDGLCIGILFWHGDEEFAPRLRFVWDENALMYIRYETMYFALGLLREKLRQ